MHLKSITLRGFKSFADPTTLEFEPGVTVVVGPNGSGKSNVVDAVAWVLGAQGPRVVRSSKMDDVIFAGTAKRPALGRAEVSLTIDNSSRRLPVDLAEVTITRTLFRTGESEYSMNGAACRLLDIQEMLSDAGVGRQQHVIMSQGQLASVLDARPEDRRAVIEEAAGVLKFRRRRERSERRLESTEANLMRLQDLVREVRRQLRPLERQAEAARRHGSLVSELGALKLYVAGRELESLQRRTAENEERRTTLAAEDERLRAELERLDGLVAASEAALTAEQSSEVTAQLSHAERLRERARGVANVVSERRRRVEAALNATTEADVISALEAESARLAGELAEAEAAAGALAPEWEALAVREAELVPEREALALRLASEGGPTDGATGPTSGGAGPTAGGTGGLSVGQLRAERDRAAAALSVARETAARATERFASLERQRVELVAQAEELAVTTAQLAESLAGLREAQSVAETAEREAAERVTNEEATARDAVESAQRLAARADALQEALDEAHARAGVESLTGQPGVLGTLLDVADVDPGYELAFEAALEEALRAVVVDDRSSARQALEHLHGLGVAGAVLPAAATGTDTGTGAGTAADATDIAGTLGSTPVDGVDPLRVHVRTRHSGVASLLDELLATVVVCTRGINAALDLIADARRGTVVVTTEGDRLSSHSWRIGAGRAGATRAALETVRIDAARADQQAASARLAAEHARQAWSTARAAASEATRAATAATTANRERQQQLTDVQHRITELENDAERAAANREEAERAVATQAVAVEELDAHLTVAETAESQARAEADEVASIRRALDDRARVLASARAELEVRAASIDERRTLLSTRRDEVERRLGGYEEARSGAADRRRAHEATATALDRIGALVIALIGQLDDAVAALARERLRHDQSVAAITERLSASRADRLQAERALTETREHLQRSELDRTELRVRLETALESLRHDLDAEVADALAAECPELPPGIPAAARVRELERELRLLGPINPLALEELAGLEERDAFLSGQLEDVRSTRRELGKVIKAIDEEIVTVFEEAFADVSRHFEDLFGTLFPGGTGKLTLLDPEDLLSSGVEIEARPAGRNVRRLSLLSGGERSLVALAFLFAVFRSRPSPFYLMDEVEAALDDVNLHRFLDLVEEFREEAQLVIVSHQKRTMESADIIYGVTMQPGGASKVVSERLRGDAEAAATA